MGCSFARLTYFPCSLWGDHPLIFHRFSNVRKKLLIPVVFWYASFWFWIVDSIYSGCLSVSYVSVFFCYFFPFVRLLRGWRWLSSWVGLYFLEDLWSCRAALTLNYMLNVLAFELQRNDYGKQFTCYTNQDFLFAGPDYKCDSRNVMSTKQVGLFDHKNTSLSSDPSRPLRITWDDSVTCFCIQSTSTHINFISSEYEILETP